MIQAFINKIGLLKFMIFLFGIGVAGGILAAWISGQNYVSNSGNLDLLFLSNIKNMEIQKGQLFWLVFEKRLKDFLLLWMFSVTVLWTPYSILFLMYQGFLGGFFLITGMVLYGLKGMLLMLAYCMPHCFIYAPVFLYLLLRGWHLNRRLYQYSYNKSPTKWKLFLEQLPAFLFLLIGLFLGCVLEAYVNVLIVQKTLTLF